jgi:hypothetical protein
LRSISPVLDRQLEDLREPRQALVDARGAQRAEDLTVRVAQRFPRGDRRLPPGALAHLRLTPAVDFLRRDRGERHRSEERQQVLGELPFAVEDRVRRQLRGHAPEPLVCEHREQRIWLLGRRLSEVVLTPASHVREDRLQLLVGASARPPIRRLPEPHLSPLTVQHREADRERAAALPGALDHLSRCWTCHQDSPSACSRGRRVSARMNAS